MDVLFSFGLPKEGKDKLEEKILKGQTVDPKGLMALSSPDPGDVQRLVDWLKKQGFGIL